MSSPQSSKEYKDEKLHDLIRNVIHTKSLTLLITHVIICLQMYLLNYVKSTGNQSNIRVLFRSLDMYLRTCDMD